MAKIGENAFRQYKDGQDRMTALEYMRDREILRLGVNDLEDKIDRFNDVARDLEETNTRVDTSLSETEGRMSSLEQDLGTVNTGVQSIQQDLGTVSENVESVQQDLGAISENVESIQQNEILTRLSIVDGVLHLDGVPIVIAPPANPDQPTNPTNPTDPPPATVNTFGKIGKWFEETVSGEKVFSTHFPGSFIEADVVGATSIIGNFVFTGRGWPEAPFIAVRLNGGAWNRIRLADQVTLASGLNASTTYKIEVVFDGWNQTEHLWNTQRKFTIKSLQVGSGSISYTNRKKNVLFIGDSITAGTKTLSSSDLAAGNSHVNTYAKMLGDKMGVNVIPSAFPGTKVMDTFTRTNFNQVTNNTQAGNLNIHTVVIFMGTNDFGQDSAGFISAYQQLIDAVRAVYPTQRIYILGLVERINDIRRNTELATIASSRTNVKHINTSSLANPAYTDDLHPSTAGSQSIANFVYPLLVADNWEAGGGGSPNPDPEPEPEPTPTVPEGNLWTAAGQQSSYNPLPAAFLSAPLPGSYAGTTFEVSFQARSASGNSKVKVYTEWMGDLAPVIVDLTSAYKTFTKSFTVNYSGDGNFIFIVRNDFSASTDIDIKDIVFKKTGSTVPTDPEPTDPEPTDPDPTPGTPTVPDGNLWTLAGLPTSYNPLPTGWAAALTLPATWAGNQFRITFKARSAKLGTIALYNEDQSGFPRVAQKLTNTLTSYTFDFSHNWASSDDNKMFMIRDNQSYDDIIVQDIVVTKR